MLASRTVWLATLGLVLVACTKRTLPDHSRARDGGTPAPPEQHTWRPIFEGLPGGLVSVWGTSHEDVWAVGTDSKDGRGPLVFHFDGAQWERRVALPSGDFWWVHGFAGGVVFAGGSEGLIVRFDREGFRTLTTPSTKGIVFGIWGSGPDDVWAVGGDTLKGTGAFVWRLSRGRFVEVADLPVDPKRTGAFFKVWGTSATDVWIVGTDGLSMRFDGTRFEKVETGVTDLLFTVHASPGGDFAAVGGSDLGVLLERRSDGDWERATLPPSTRQLFGVWLTPGAAFAVGTDATILERASGGWVRESGVPTDKPLHAVWIDPGGGVWAAGGDVLVPPFGGGVLLHKGLPLPTDYVFVDRGGAGGAGGTAQGGAGGTAGAGGVPTGGVSGAGGGASGGRDAGPDATGSGGQDDAGPDARVEAGPSAEAAAEAGETGPGSDPGRVRCGPATCTLPTEKCCAEPPTGVPIGCVPAGQSCPGAPVTCDEPADCQVGESCCLNRFIQAQDLVDVVCTPGNCIGPSVCAGRADCGGATCDHFLFMPTYFTCQ